MSQIKNIYKKYIKNRKGKIKESNIKLAEYLKKIKNRKRGRTLFNERIYKSIFQPSDYCRPLENCKEVIYHCLYIFLSKNQLYDSLSCFNFLQQQYYINPCFIWRVGFHIILQVDDGDKLCEFFENLKTIDISDYIHMVYEYFLHLMYFRRFEEIALTYNDAIIQKKLKSQSERIPDSEKNLVTMLIKMTVAVSCYSIWKKSLNYIEDVSNGDTAELYFRELYILINQGQMVDNYILNYIDLLNTRCKYQESLEILLMYSDKCSNNFNSLRYLLSHVNEYRNHLEGVSDEDIIKWRQDYVVKMMPIYPDGDDFTVNILVACVEDLEYDEEILVQLLFELLENKSWIDIWWPWERLYRCILNLGVDNEVVSEMWNIRKRYWTLMYFDEPNDNINITKLSSILKNA